MNARIPGIFAALALGLACTITQAADIINQDSKAYKLKVVAGGVTSHFNIRSGGSQYGTCSSTCTYEIPGSKVTASRNGVIYIRGGKLLIQKP